MGSVRKRIRSYGVGSKKSEAHKKNHKPAESRIQEIKGINCTVLD